MEPNQLNQESRGPSAAPSSNLQSTIDRVRAQQAPFGDLSKPGFPVFHRVRNEATEKELSDKPWCGAERWQGTDHVTILDCDVTCPACIEIINRRQVQNGTLPLTHFDGGWGETLCGQSQAAVTMAATLRETRCQRCQDAAEELLVGVITDGSQSKTDLSFEKITKVAADYEDQNEYRGKVLRAYDENTAALRDIGSTLETLLALEQHKQGI